MEKLRNTILIASLVLAGLTIPIRAEMATMDEALTVAKNWVTLIIQKKGNWGGSETAEVEGIQEFKRGQRLIGYFCRVMPKGHIVISLRKELAPIKIYSATSDLAPECEEGMADLVKGKMERILDEIERQVGPITSARTEDLENILEINYRQSWEELEGDVATFRQQLDSSVITMDYQGGDPPLLSSHWHQDPPYNDDCPSMGCANWNGRAIVGCVATAGAQIMRYWNWPPYGVSPYNDSYDWPNMPDTVTTSSPQTQIDAVAELSSEVGVAVGMVYGCSFSGAYHEDMRDVYRDYFRYSTSVNIVFRDDFDSGIEWFDHLKTDLNVNRPLQYGIPEHSIVLDGWQEIGDPPLRQYHMNYGWGQDCNTPNGCDTWYNLDALHGGDLEKEEMIQDIYPATILWGSVSGTYVRASFPYRYFDRDTTGSSATFEAGQNLQFLPRITAKCTSTTGDYIRIVGSSSLNTRLFSIKGTAGAATIAGIQIYNGGIRMYQNGGMRFHE